MNNLVWVVQDVFSSGIPGPGYHVCSSREEALALEEYGKSWAILARQCDCGSLIGLDDTPLQGGCQECR